MSQKKYSLFHLQGGFGKHIAATAVAKCIKNNFPSRELIVTGVWVEIFQNLPFVDRVYQMGNTSYYYQTYVEGMDSLVFANEPYFTTDHVNKTLPLVQTWCKMYNLDYNGEMPQIKFNPLQRKGAKDFWPSRANGKPIMVIQTNGGMYQEQRPYLWARDMPVVLAQKIVDRYADEYHIFQVTNSSFLPREPSPKMTSYLSSLISLTKNTLASLVMLGSKILSTRLYTSLIVLPDDWNT